MGDDERRNPGGYDGLDWVGVRALRGSPRVRQGLIKRPFPACAWDELYRLPLAHMPWPYTDDQAQQICSLLPDEFRDSAFEIVIFSARRYVHVEKVRRTARANPHKEIKALGSALKTLHEALVGLSPGAHAHLHATLRPVRAAGEAPFSASSLLHAIDQFDHQNWRGLKSPPSPIRGGPATRNQEAWLVVRLQCAFSIAHGGKRPKLGWPEFRTRCVAPLQEFGLVSRSEKGWQDVLRKNKKRRNNSSKKG